MYNLFNKLKLLQIFHYVYLTNMFNSTGGINQMKNIKYFFIGIFIVSLFSLQSCTQKTQDIESVKKQIEEKQTSFMENFNNGNAKALSEGYTADAVVLPPHAPAVSGNEAIEKLWKSFFEMGKASVKLSTVNTVVSGKLAVIYTTY